jgi:hypothetical protein
MYMRFAMAAALVVAFYLHAAQAANLVLSTSQGPCTIPLQSGSNVSIDPASGDVHAAVGPNANCPQLAGVAILTVSRDGTGSGSVSSAPAGISCGATCSASFPAGTSVTLTPTASAGSVFAGWAGHCTGTGACTVTMNQARNVTATFNAAPTFNLTVSRTGTGTGTVTSSPAGINCGATCSAAFASGSTVNLTATAAAGSTFAGWSGACTGTGNCSVTMSEARSVTAQFNPSGGSVPEGCENIVPPAGFTRANSTTIKFTVQAEVQPVDATLYSRLFKAQSEADTPWPGSGTSRGIRMPRMGYLSGQFSVPTSGGPNMWYLEFEDHLDVQAPRVPIMLTVSTCPGHFDTTGPNAVDARCRFFQQSVSGNFYTEVVTNAASYAGNRCPIERGRTYFLNMIGYDPANGTPTCPQGTTQCSWFGSSRTIP